MENKKIDSEFLKKAISALENAVVKLVKDKIIQSLNVIDVKTDIVQDNKIVLNVMFVYKTDKSVDDYIYNEGRELLLIYNKALSSLDSVSKTYFGSYNVLKSVEDKVLETDDETKFNYQIVFSFPNQ